MRVYKVAISAIGEPFVCQNEVIVDGGTIAANDLAHAHEICAVIHTALSRFAMTQAAIANHDLINIDRKKRNRRI